MSLSNADVTHLLLALVLLLVAAHGLGWLFVRLRQPKVAGEILGGLLLGPTVFGLLLPSWHHAVFRSGTATPATLGVFYQLGLFLLMYCSGAELRSILARRERKATLGIALLANAVPFVAGVVFLRFYDSARFLGPARPSRASPTRCSSRSTSRWSVCAWIWCTTLSRCSSSSSWHSRA